MSDNIFSKAPDILYSEPAVECDFGEFTKVIESRRSVRHYTNEPIPDAVVEECLRLGLLAPNSSNLQPWEFYWVKSPDKLQRLKEYCLNQPAARTAPTLIVCVARPDLWQRGQKINQIYFSNRQDTPKSVHAYYNKLVPFVYGNGPLNILAPFKSLAVFFLGMFRVIPRGPFGRSGNLLWATKTTALACENLMLAFRAAGYDSCPMEGFDEVRVKKLLNLPSGAAVTMIISAGKRSEKGIYAERIRGSQDLFIKKV
ncbi:nitroreductase family protein [Bdellovibrio bacteriovorus]|uniref:Nitroreductase family protein n=1 Tax=Bdellovibrio bacteriovorus (strain ATCC 15356 / DSM 50701 / NCIMB 9529 / HD100) TaxID=264462 RepID=Q6ML69_BDEBA|nr:nitroreductase family protein [Bdellovibrio bacteriovorus]AHZ84690.1 nitroreductase [Bdellovibrio bacteriovorus]BEV68580.1 Protein DrgA [Bdellovibrio bacteriovorus]CAE79988.1 nitroreductase family protein [Bdellovibrio bacteriovorus HD100]